MCIPVTALPDSLRQFALTPEIRKTNFPPSSNSAENKASAFRPPVRLFQSPQPYASLFDKPAPQMVHGLNLPLQPHLRKGIRKIVRACVIFNPTAKGDKARNFRKQLGEFGAEAEMRATTRAGAASQLAKAAV